MTAYYNEFDKNAAQWLRNLIISGHIAPGYVDERSIEDVYPSDLQGFTQCHFFAGIGVWSHAIRSSGWSDDRPVWTGSCPCQPFSAAGKGGGFDDERHLWPAFHHLIKQCKPSIIFGEQVASKAVEPWIDLVHADLEALDYAFGCVPFPSAGVGAPHIRDRAYWVANTKSTGSSHGGSGSILSIASKNDGIHAGGLEHAGQNNDASEVHAASDWESQADRPANIAGGPSLSFGRMADHDCDGCESRSEGCETMGHGQAAGADRGVGGLADNLMQQRPDGKSGIGHVDDAGGRVKSAATPSGLCGDMRPGPVNGFWRDADWLGCRDGKWRPVEPGTFPLVNGATSRVVRLRAYGNAINAKAAQAFIESVM